MAANQSSPRSGAGGMDLGSALIYGSLAVNILISVLTLVGNTLVLAAFITTQKLRRCQTNFFIASLAIADLISGCVAVPLWTSVVQGRFASFAGYSPQYLAFQVFDVFSGVASILHLMCISLERNSSTLLTFTTTISLSCLKPGKQVTGSHFYVISAFVLFHFLSLHFPFIPDGRKLKRYFAIVWPVVHHLTNSLTYFLIMAVIWVVSITASVVSLEAAHWREKYVIFNSITLFGIPFLVIIFCYLSILRSTLRRSLVKSTRNLEQEVKVSVTVFILVALFVVTWCPFFSVAIVSSYCTKCFSMTAIILLKCLHYSNSFCNPIVYAARIPDFRKAFHKLLPKNMFRLFPCHNDEHHESPRTSRVHSFTLAENQPKSSRLKPGIVDEKSIYLRVIPNHNLLVDSGDDSPGIISRSESPLTEV